MRRLATVAGYALVDLLHERRITVLTILIYAVILTPVTLLYAAKEGVVGAWTTELSRDTRNREVRLLGERPVPPAELEAIRGWSETGFAVPEETTFVTTNTWRRVEPMRGEFADLNLRTTEPGDPVFGARVPVPTGLGEIALSHEAAERLGAGRSDVVEALLRRRPRSGGVEAARPRFTVVAVLDEALWPDETVFVSPAVARSIRAYLWFELDPDPDFPAGATLPDGPWSSLRIYAPTIEAAPALRDRLQEAGFDTQLRTDQIERLTTLRSGLDALFVAMLAMAVTGFAAAVFLMQWLGVARKRRDYALLITVGFPRREIALMPLVQTAAVVSAGFAVSLVALVLATPGIAAFARRFVQSDAVGTISASAMAGGYAAAILIGALGSAWAVAAIGRLEITRALRSD